LELVENAWERVKSAALKETKAQGGQDASGSPTQDQNIQDIKNSLLALTKELKDLKGQGKLRKPTYAEAARSQEPYKAQAKTGNTRTLPVPKRHYQESLIRPGKTTASQESFYERDWVRKANEALGHEAVLRIRKLPSGDMIIRFKDKEGKEEWEKSPELWKAFGQEARCQAREYTVLAFGVQVDSLNQEEQAKSIKEIYAQNPLLESQVGIIRIGWAKRTLQQGRVYAALHIGVSSPEQANVLIKQGLYLGQVYHHCEPFFKECQVSQCVKCYEYTHIAKRCLKVAYCGYCTSKEHISLECPKKNTPELHQCIVCKDTKANHAAWAQECPVRRREQEKARQAYRLRPKQFQERNQPQELRWENRTATLVSPSRSIQASKTGNKRTIQEDEEEEPYSQDNRIDTDRPEIVVPSTQTFSVTASQEEAFLNFPTQGSYRSRRTQEPKRKRGRPSDLQRAAENVQDIRIFQQTPHLQLQTSVTPTPEPEL